MKMPAALSAVVSMACLAGAFAAFAQRETKQSPPDFRRAVWGMTPSQVMETEANGPVRTSESSGEVVLQYGASKLGALTGTPVYVFAKDKLVRAKFLFEEEHGDQNEFISRFSRGRIGAKGEVREA
jgi:hypothetical protein